MAYFSRIEPRGTRGQGDGGRANRATLYLETGRTSILEPVAQRQARLSWGMSRPRFWIVTGFELPAVVPIIPRQLNSLTLAVTAPRGMFLGEHSFRVGYLTKMFLVCGPVNSGQGELVTPCIVIGSAPGEGPPPVAVTRTRCLYGRTDGRTDRQTVRQTERQTFLCEAGSDHDEIGRARRVASACARVRVSSSSLLSRRFSPGVTLKSCLCVCCVLRVSCVDACMGSFGCAATRTTWRTALQVSGGLGDGFLGAVPS